MKPLRLAASLLLLFSAIPPSQAAAPNLPDDSDREGWNRLVDQFAECSAVYNIAAASPKVHQKGPADYRELANHALVAGSFSAQHIGLTDNYLESIYSVKFAHWENIAKYGSQPGKLFEKVDQCLADWLPVQTHLVGALRQ